MQPKIVQLLIGPDNATWQNTLLGLGDDGATYFCNSSGRWEAHIPPVNEKSDELSRLRELVKEMREKTGRLIDKYVAEDFPDGPDGKSCATIEYRSAYKMACEVIAKADAILKESGQ